MKRIFTLLLFSTIIQQAVLAAAAPTVPASNLTFNTIDGSRFYGALTAGNGAGRIVVVKEGSPVTGVPVNGVDYAAHFNFGTAGTEFSAPGEYVVSRSGWATFSAEKLKPGTTYYVAIFEYNGSGAGITYLNLPLTGSQSTVVAPTAPASAITVTASTGNTLSLSWAKGNGTGRTLIARKGAPVNGHPVDAGNYSANDVFGSGSKLGTDNYIIYAGTGTSVTMKGLEPNTTYYFSLLEYNGISYPVYLTPGAVANATTNAGPGTAPSNVTYSYVEGNSYRVNVTIGNGTRRLFIAKKGAAVTATPVTGTTYTANSTFGAGTEIAPGEFVVGATANNWTDMNNLEPNTTYHVRVFEYDVNAAGYPYYFTGGSAVKSGSTSTTPSTICSALKINSLSGSTASIGFTVGNGTYRIAIMKAGSPVDAVPANLTRYTGNADFGSGTQVSPGNYCIQGGMNGSSFTVNKLLAGVTYYVSIYEFNGNSYPVYSATGATFSFTVPVEPTAKSTAPAIFWPEGKSFRLQWTNGNGAARLVIAKKGSAVTASPVDLTTYTGNDNFGLGQEIAPGEFVVSNNSNNYVDLKGMELSTTYHFAVFEYNVDASGKPDYLTSSFLTHSGSTITWPTTQPTITSVSGIQATQAVVNFTAGNGTSRLLVAKKGAPVSVTPTDLTKYSYNGTFGTAGSHLGDGNYVFAIASSGGTANIYGLEANTTYYVSAFEFNGSNEPAYLRTAPSTTSFTTTDVPGATTPTVASTAAIVSAIDGNKFTLKWTNGNGEKRLVVMKQGSPVTFVPAAATTYTANASFANGTDLGGGQYTVMNGTANTVDITNLQPASTYYYTVFEYNGAGTLLRYLTTSVLTASASTLSAPVSAPSSPVVTAGASSLSISWTNGSGTSRLVVMKEGTAVTSSPATGSAYPANAVFKIGSQVTAGEYVVYAGTGNAVTVTGLDANKTYHYSIFEYNGVAAPVYNLTASSGFAMAAGSLPIHLLYFKAREENGDVVLNWATAQESNNKFFTIEKSTNGGSFAVVKELPGAINSDRKIEYNYTDVKGATGKAWYRLKQTDLDGRYTYSDAVLVNPATASGKISLSPNPAQSLVRIVWPGTAKEAVLVAYTASGIAVKQEKLVAGRAIDCAGWKPGTYYLTVFVDGKQYQSTLIKQ
ncbi:T9SS type A sorting domain-containing protein [Paraflavitalea sp. CAU 1676]|uniref:T9SS type A sorting domain-containing protein n=1 Tax=Paraflavitalea sp. CAU 1676 TaxID=3032598 RepID=UPI0023DC74F2|nr:T9SS type A sorting domain-containing protein [Paraflavitalea sp. CAU 1676]MDF2190040.1 T9SS type A sorting domain-containing protein [Paraflavitalea sp. CAU 1676]